MHVHPGKLAFFDAYVNARMFSLQALLSQLSFWGGPTRSRALHEMAWIFGLWAKIQKHVSALNVAVVTVDSFNLVHRTRFENNQQIARKDRKEKNWILN